MPLCHSFGVAGCWEVFAESFLERSGCGDVVPLRESSAPGLHRSFVWRLSGALNDVCHPQLGGERDKFRAGFAVLDVR